MTKTNDYINQLRADFPTLRQSVNGKPLVYLDNGATAQKPQLVINRIKDYYEKENANIHRGVHTLSQEATEAYEQARKSIQKFINAGESDEVIFTSGTTQSINLIAATIELKKGDEVLISAMEHHSNIVPWQMACEKSGAHLKIMPINNKGEINLEQALPMISGATKIVSVVHVSNSLGTINPVNEIIEKAKQHNALSLLDGAQAVPHMKVDVQALDCDFYAFSGHKMFGPTGTGILYGKRTKLEALPPYMGGGDMIKTVSFEKTVYNELPHKFEAGTPNIAGGIALGTAAEYLMGLDWNIIHEHEQELLHYATSKLRNIPGIRLIGEAENKASVVSFLVDGTHPYDLGMILDKLGIAVRTGHHCTQPLMDLFQIPGTCRASFCFYNTKEDVDVLMSGIERAVAMLV